MKHLISVAEKVVSTDFFHPKFTIKFYTSEPSKFFLDEKCEKSLGELHRAAGVVDVKGCCKLARHFLRRKNLN